MLNTKLPLWYQVAQSLRGEIGTRTPDDLRLPTEAELANRYGVSVITIRQALKSLEDEGLISRYRRRGTFINPDALPRRELKLLGSMESVFLQQASETADVLERKLIKAPTHLEPDFGSGAEVMLFRRVRRDAGEPVSYAVNYVRADVGKKIQRRHLRDTSMSKVIRDGLGVKIKRIQDTVEAQLASPEVAVLLHVELLSPILQLVGRSYDDNNRVIDLAMIAYRGDRYRFSVDFYVD